MQSRTKRVWSGTIAQLVEQRTENPCVAGSIPAGTTKKALYLIVWGFFDFRVQRRVHSNDLELVSTKKRHPFLTALVTIY